MQLVSLQLRDVYADVQNIIAKIGDIIDTDVDRSNGLFGKNMYVSSLSHSRSRIKESLFLTE